jgi:hypothetical protein
LTQRQQPRSEDLFVLKERVKKKRKKTRKLRVTGVPSQGERKHKGWSDEGMVAFKKHVGAIRKDAEDDKVRSLGEGLSGVMVKLVHLKKDDDEPLQQARHPHHEPNLSVVCDGFWRFNFAVFIVWCPVCLLS